MSPALLDPVEAFRIADGLDPQADPYVDDPKGWVNDRLGEFIWSKQVEVAESVRDHRYTAVPSAHDTGKSHIASRLIAWWLSVHPLGDAFAVSTAPTQTQVEAILWREVGRAHRLGGLPGRITAGAIPMWKSGTEIIGFGRKPADYADEDQARAAFQGIHAKHILIVLDEAGGIPSWLWEAVDSLATNASARVLAIGNPDSPVTPFKKVCDPGSGWNVVPISAFDTPAYTGEEVPVELLDVLVSREWVEERKKRWGVGSALYASKVKGEFPETTEDTVIQPLWVRQAVERDLSAAAIREPGRYGVDVARSGSAETVITRNRAGYVRCEYARVGVMDTMRIVGEVYKRIEPHKGLVPATVDVIGIGAGVYDRLAEQGLNVHPFNAAEKATEPIRFKNRRAEAWWAARDLFNDGALDIDPEDEELQSQLQAPRWYTDSSGRIVIESKDDLAKRGIASPDRADAFIMSVIPAPEWEGYTEDETEAAPTETGDLIGRPM